MAALAIIAVMTLSPVATPAPTARGFCIVCGGVGGVDAVLNLLLFVPLGFALGLAGWRAWRAFTAVVLITAAVEALQLTVITGRDASGGDVVMNTLGGAIGYWSAVTRRRWLRPTATLGGALALAAAGGWLGIQAVSAHAFGISLSDRPWYGQMRRHFPQFAPFERRVGAVMLGDMPLREHRFESAAVRDALLHRHPTVHVRLLPGPEPRRTAPIYRIADDRRDEVLMLGRVGSALVFRLRTRAADLRLRRPTFVMNEAFAGATGDASAHAESTVVAARMAADRVVLTASGPTVSRERTIHLSASWGWVLVMPFTMLLTSAATTIGTSLWLAGLLLPVGYWVYHARTSQSRASQSMAVAGCLVVMTLGLHVVPVAFGLGSAPLYEWAAAAAGLSAGWSTAVLARRPPTRNFGDSSG